MVIQDSEQDEELSYSVSEGVAELRLNRPDKRNAFSENTIRQLRQAIESASQDRTVRAIMLCAAGKHFSAGADLEWMRRLGSASFEENRQDAEALAALMSELYCTPKPTIAAVQGAAFGGALGLISCCDIVVASEDAKFCLSEVKLGLAPSAISPYVTKAIGERAMRRYTLTAEVFAAEAAKRLGLVHEVVPPEHLDSKTMELTRTLSNNAPEAMSKAKALLHKVSNEPLSPALIGYTANLIAELRLGDEAQEGLSAFLEKRKPNWQKEQ